MSLTNISAPNSGKKKYQRLEDGTFVGRIVQIIDLGVQEDEYDGEKKIAHKVFINFEFPTETVEIGGEDKPMWLGKEYPVTLHEKSALTKLIQAADPDGKATAKGRNMKGLLGQPMMITIGTTKGGNAKIAGFARLMKGMQVAELSKEPLFFDMDTASKEDYEALPQWIQNKILAGLDFKDTALFKKLDVEAHPDTIEDIEDSPY